MKQGIIKQIRDEMHGHDLQLLDLELKKLEIQRLRDGEDGAGDDPTPVNVTIHVVDASKKMPNINPTLNVPQANFLQLPNKFRAFVAGFGCMHGDTLIATAFGFKKIKEIASPTLVLSWSHKSNRFELALSGGAFPKGEANLYRVSTEQGEFVASGHHRLLCADGTYRSVESLSVGEKVFASSQNLQQTNLGEFRYRLT